jgi:hypothetical protein
MADKALLALESDDLIHAGGRRTATGRATLLDGQLRPTACSGFLWG